MTRNKINWYQGDLYTSAVKTLFDMVIPSSSYSEWKERFSDIHGVFDTQRKIDIEKLERNFGFTIGNDRETLFRFIFCLETYYSVILRIITYKAVFGDERPGESIFDDKTYRAKGISNYTCVSYYNWFLMEPAPEFLIERIYEAVDLRDLDTEGDAIARIFESIFPKEIRHSIGEYYTPYWLANEVIDRITNDDKTASEKKFIDPACGSGTFLVALINKFRESSENSIFSNICGIDINPLTVLAAKTNFILAYERSCGFNPTGSVEIPIYCADTIAINNSPALFDNTKGNDSVPKIKYDYIVGNPPWVNWEYLPDAYRMRHAPLWKYYGLFSQKGLNSNFIKEDISVLLTYVVIDNYLKIGGKIGFIVKETLFKSIKQGEGFRQFRILPKGTDLKVIRVDDLSKIRPFKDAVTRTAVIYIEKGSKTVYPVDYIVWKLSTKTQSFDRNRLFNLFNYFTFEQLKARPSVKTAINSGWITESEDEMNYSNYILGSNSLVARTGVFTGGANGIYWLSIDADQNDKLLVSNITERARNKMKKVHMPVEKEYVFPFLTGNDLGFWQYSYSKYILCPHTSETKMRPVDNRHLEHYPLTRRYFAVFRKELEGRKGFTSIDEPIHRQFFYTLQRIGDYTFARYKVCWRYISRNFTPAVVEYANDDYLGRKNIIGNEKIISIAFDDRDEAYFVCAVISSTPYRKTIENYIIGTQITPSIISRLNIPRYDSHNRQHLELSRLCREGHFADGAKAPYIEQIDAIIRGWFN